MLHRAVRVLGRTVTWGRLGRHLEFQSDPVLGGYLGHISPPAHSSSAQACLAGLRATCWRGGAASDIEFGTPEHR